jgi:hypothetical protein
MRLASLLLFAILLSCVSFQACAIEPGDIAAPSIAAPNMDMPTPKITSPNMGMSGPKQVQQDVSDSKDKIVDQSDDLSGKWSIKFDNLPDRSLDLTLWSSGKTKIMGYGTLAKGSTSNSVTVSGSIAGEELIFAVQSADSEYSGHQNSDKYDLSLFQTNNTMSGTYILSVEGEFMSDGNATAIKR